MVKKKICLQCGRPRLNPWVRKIPWRREWQPTSVFLPGESHGWRSLEGYSPRGHKESDMTELLTHNHKRGDERLIQIKTIKQCCKKLKHIQRHIPYPLDFILLKISIPSKLIYRFNAIPTKIPMMSSAKLETPILKRISNFMETQTARTILKKKNKTS